MDTLLITDLEAIAHIGVKEDERSVPQTLLINVKAVADFNKAAQSDCVEDTNSYSAIAKHIKKIVSETRYHLLEALAHHILRELFQAFDLKEITITRSIAMPPTDTIDKLVLPLCQIRPQCHKTAYW